MSAYIWCDGNASVIWSGYSIENGGATMDTAYLYFIRPCELQITHVLFSDGRDSGYTALQCGNYITPGSGVFCELVLHCRKADTISVSGYIKMMGDAFSWWLPLYSRLDTAFVVPTEFPTSPGDVNCSQSISISDAVFLIKYIFAGGCAPCNSDAADVNGNCAVSISDAVYLINYIFAGGNAPLPGCVVP